MSKVVTVDDRGRIKLPKGLVSPGDKILVITAGSRIILIPIPPRPLEASASWLNVRIDRKAFRRMIEEEALKEVEKKLRRTGRVADRD